MLVIEDDGAAGSQDLLDLAIIRALMLQHVLPLFVQKPIVIAHWKQTMRAERTNREGWLLIVMQPIVVETRSTTY